MIKKLSKEFMKFCIVGLIATSISYAVFYAGVEIFKINYLISCIISFVFGVLSGYPLNRMWTFSAKNHAKNKIKHYFGVYIISLILSLIFLKITVEYVGINPLIAYVLSIAITTCTNFVGTRFFVFK